MTHPETEGRIVGTPDHDNGGPGPDIMAADSLDDEKVFNLAGEDLGTVRHIMLDVRRGRIAYAVLSFGGVLGMGDKLFAIPWAALQLDVDNECFVLDVDKDVLKKAEGFDKDHWPAMADPRWAEQLHAYYTIPPYWR